MTNRDTAAATLGRAVESEAFGQWIKCSDRMPESDRRTLVQYMNENGKVRIEIAAYIPSKTIKAEDYFSDEAWGCEEYDEETDTVWVEEGWYEDSWTADTNWRLGYEVAYWMPLPQATVPTESTQAKPEAVSGGLGEDNHERD